MIARPCVGEAADARRKLRRCGLGFGIVSALVVMGEAVISPLPAQSAPAPARLTLRPRTAAAGPRSNPVGTHRLDSLGSTVYVPQQCAGAQRCPLVVYLAWMSAWSGLKPADELKYLWVPVADTYGMIVLAPAKALDSAFTQSLPEADAWDWDDLPHVRTIDAAMKRALQTLAIDPHKVALVGWNPALDVGGGNLDVFSRIVAMMPMAPPTDGVASPRRTTEFLLYGIADGDAIRFSLGPVRALRRRGHRVTYVLGAALNSLLAAMSNVASYDRDDYDYVGQWLQASWARPDRARHPAPQVLTDPLPALTTDVLHRLTTFWTHLQSEPDSSRRTIIRRAPRRDVAVPIGGERLSVRMADMAAIAAQYPWVAAALQSAGLTAQQYDRYRVALLSAAAIGNLGSQAGSLSPTSVLRKNVEFMLAHLDEFAEIKEWLTR